MPPTPSQTSASSDWVIVLGLGVVGVLLLPIVRYVLALICLHHVRRYCASHAIEVSGWRLAPKFGEDGIKTEYTCVEVLSEGSEEKKIHRFIVWIFGIREVSETADHQTQTK
jgi:hypothetical protein